MVLVSDTGTANINVVLVALNVLDALVFLPQQLHFTNYLWPIKDCLHTLMIVKDYPKASGSVGFDPGR
jgi:hypothetical protein